MSDSSSAGRVFAVTTAGADITGFDPARDKLDLGDVSVHNFIVVDTPTGVGFMNPWSGETVVVRGVSLGQLTVDSFLPVINDHLRQCLSGALAWEQGVTAAPHTVYARSHELGQVDRVAFDPATDVVDFRYYGTREQISMTDGAEGVVIANAGTGQALILLGVTVAQLGVTNFLFYPAEVREDRVHLQLGLGTVPDSQVVAQGLPVVGTTAWPSGVGAGAPPSGVEGTTFAIAWLYGTDTVLDFDPATDRLDFGWFKASEFSLAEVGGSTVITIDGNRQTYTLTGVGLGALEMGNIVALDPGARAEWQAALDAAPAPPPRPAVSVGDAQAVEGPGGAALAFTVSLSAAAATPVSVSYSTLNGSARAGEDFAAAVGTVTFAPGETRKTVAVAVLDDSVHELAETLTLLLSSPVGATILDGSGAGGIADDDPDPAPGRPPAIAIVDYATAEGDADLTHMRILLTLSKASTLPVTVHYATADVTATGELDYEVLDGVVTFAPGETTQTIHAHIHGDTTVEPTETYRVLLSSPTNATLSDAEGLVTIANDDAPPSFSIADATVTEGNAGSRLLTLTVTLSQPAAGEVSVAYGTYNGTATAGSDYTAKSGRLTFAAGETSRTIQVSVKGDTLFEANETFEVRLRNPSGAGIADGTAVATITNDDTRPQLTIADASIVEGNGGSKLLNLTVTLNKPAAGTVTIGWYTANGTAIAGSDYTAATGTLSFAAGELSKTIQVAIAGDTLAEASETFEVRLRNPVGAAIRDGIAVATIANDDTAPPAGGASLAYAVDNNWGSGFTASMTVAAGTGALNGWTAEFDAAFTISNIWNAVIVSHVGNHYVIRNESYNAAVPAGGQTSFGFQAAGGSTTVSGLSLLATPAGTLPSVSVADASVTEGASGAAMLAFTVTLSAASASPVTVGYATANGTATAGSDYTAKTGTLTFAAGETSKVVTVSVAGDTVVEPNETLRLDLSAATGATIGDGQATGTIVNDDTAPALPSLAVNSPSVTEGASGTKNLAFTVSLSAPAAGPVTVGYATANGTATAGSDYTAKTGTLTFAAGETSKVVNVTVAGDTAYEPNETVKLTLSNAVGAGIATATGTGTILNDDAAPTPSLAIRDATVTEGDPGAGWFSTAGNQIVDAAGNTVQIAGVNWFGFEGTNMSPNGLWTRGYKEMMQQMADEGFNAIRLPFSSDMLRATGPALGIDAGKNADLAGLTPLQVMDRIVAHAEQIGLRIILDHHRSSAGNGASENGLWYDATHSQAQWIADWQMLATRYAGNAAVIGADLHNEPYNGSWGGGGANDWAAAAEAAGNAIGAVNPNWLIFVEGIATYQGQSYWWGGNLMGVRDRPIQLDVANKLVYSAHDYPNSVYAQPWFQGPDFPANLPAKFDQMWGYIYKENIAPVFLGEFGTKLQDPKDAPWLDAITAYLGGDLDNNGTRDIAAGKQGVSWTYWSWNPNSGDTGGILQDDWQTVNQAKMAYLRPIVFDLPDIAPGGPTAYATFEVTLSAPATTAVTVAYRTVADSAAAADFAAATGTLTFAPGEQSKLVRIAILGDEVAEGTEEFSVLLSSPVGATIADGSATGTILDDDGAGTALSAAVTAAPVRVVTGSAAAEVLTGGGALLIGGGGRDTLLGGPGADSFRFDSAADGADAIRGFVPGEDRLWVEAAGFGGGLVAGMDLAASGRFVAGSVPDAARGQFFYDRATETLGWDADGTGPQVAQHLATFDPGTKLEAADILVV